MNSLKCAVSDCLNTDRRCEFLVCQGLCQMTFHGLCIGLERNWMSSKLKDNYVCDKCIQFQDVLKNANALNLMNIEKLCDTSNLIINKASKSLESNMEMMESVCQRVDDFTANSNNLSEIDLEKIKSSVNQLLDVSRSHCVLSIKELFKNFAVQSDNIFCELTNIVAECCKNAEHTSAEMSALKSSVDHLNLIALDSISSISASCEETRNTNDNYSNLSNDLKKISKRLDNIELNMNRNQSTNPSINIKESIVNSCTTISRSSLNQSGSLLSELTLASDSISSLKVTRSKIPKAVVRFMLPDQLPEPVSFIFKYGVNWSRDEWLNRIEKLNKINKIATARGSISKTKATMLSDVSLNVEFFITRAPILADPDWMRNKFLRAYAIHIETCVPVVPKSKKKEQLTYSCFKVSIPAKYQWIFHNAPHLDTIGKNMRIQPWTDRSKSTSSKLNSKFNRSVGKTSSKKDLSTINKSPNVSNNSAKRNSTINNSSKNSKSNTNTLRSHLLKNNYSNFSQGETFTPGNLTFKPVSNIPEISTTPQPETIPPAVHKDSPQIYNPIEQSSRHSNVSPSFCDPLIPPLVNLTQKSVLDNDSRYVLARLRDNKIFENVRLFLSYLHDKDDTVCIGGKTNTSLRIAIQQEGLPCDLLSLRRIYDKFHLSFGISALQVSSDLNSYASHVSSNRTIYLQRVRENHDKFFRPQPPRNSKQLRLF